MQIKIGHLFFCTTLSVGLFACSTTDKAQKNASPPQSFKSFLLKSTLTPYPDLTIHHYIHQTNGLEVFIRSQPGTRVVALVTAYNVGSRFEVHGRTGLAHLFEHLMFRGTKSFPEPFKTLASWGNQFNAFTAEDLTLYHEVAPRVVMDDLVKFESERMRYLKISKEDFEKERGSVVSERKMRTEDNPVGKVLWELTQLAFDKHPYKTSPIGWQKDLDATSYEDALAFYKRFYAPNRAKIAIAGDFTLNEALRLLDKHYGDFTAEPWVEPVIEKEPERFDLRRKVIKADVQSVHMVDASLGPTLSDKRGAALEALACTLLAGSKIGYYNFALVERGIASQIMQSCDAGIDPALSLILVVGHPGVKENILEQSYLQAQNNFPKWLNKDRVEKAKLLYLAGQLDSLRSPAALAKQIAQAAVTTGNALHNFDYLEEIKTLTVEDLREHLKKRKKSPTRIVLVPAKSIKEGQ